MFVRGGGHLELNNGFTLIELLAVIVILAIIALIATPIILDVIDSTKRSAVLRSTELYLNGVEQQILSRNLIENFNPYECEIQSDGNLICDNISLVIESKGDRPTSGTIVFEEGKIIDAYGIEIGNYELEMHDDDVVLSSEIKDDTCRITYKTTTPNAPDIGDLTPVKYDGENWVITTINDPTWYNYRNQKWANAVVLSETGVGKK